MRYIAEETVFAVEWDVIPVDTDEGFSETGVMLPIPVNPACAFSLYCNCQPVIPTYGLFLVITALILDATFPFSLFIDVSAAVVFGPANVITVVGATYAIGVIFRRA